MIEASVSVPARTRQSASAYRVPYQRQVVRFLSKYCMSNGYGTTSYRLFCILSVEERELSMYQLLEAWSKNSTVSHGFCWRTPKQRDAFLPEGEAC